MTTSAQVVIAPPGSVPLQVVDVELPDPGPYEVLVEITATGVCHSQLHMMDEPGRDRTLMLGHEASAVVLGVGGEVDTFAGGDRVLISWLPRLVDQRTPSGVVLDIPGYGTASTHNTFTWASHALVDERFLVHAPENVPADLASILGCAVLTGAGAVLTTASVKAGDSVAVFGLGGVGLCAVAAAKAIGADPVFAVDISEEKLELARRFGASHGINSLVQNASEAIHAATPGQLGASGVDHAVDCVALPSTLSTALKSTRTAVRTVDVGGIVTVVGVPGSDILIDRWDFLPNEKRLQASFGGSSSPARDIPIFAEWYREGKLDLDALVSARFSLDEVNDAVAELRAGRVAGRAILEPVVRGGGGE